MSWTIRQIKKKKLQTFFLAPPGCWLPDSKFIKVYFFLNKVFNFLWLLRARWCSSSRTVSRTDHSFLGDLSAKVFNDHNPGFLNCDRNDKYNKGIFPRRAAWEASCSEVNHCLSACWSLLMTRMERAGRGSSRLSTWDSLGIAGSKAGASSRRTGFKQQENDGKMAFSLLPWN